MRAPPTWPGANADPWRRIANNWADLVDGTVFTGALASGASGGLTCANFTSNTANGGVTLIGNYDETTVGWTFNWQFPCASPSRIYCFEQ